MRRMAVWFVIWMQRQIRNISTWLVAAFFIFTLWILSAARGTAGNGWRVLLWNEDGSCGEELTSALLKKESSYQFEEAASRDELIRQVETGQAECGFIIEDGFEETLASWEKEVLQEGSISGEREVLQDGNRKENQDHVGEETEDDPEEVPGRIVYVNSSFTTKGAGAKETVFAVIYEEAAGQLLEKEASTLLSGFNGQGDQKDQEDQEQALRDRYLSLRESDKVFRVEYRRFTRSSSSAEAVGQQTRNDQTTDRHPVRAMGLVLVFMSLLVLGRLNKTGAVAEVSRALTSRERFGFEWVSNFCAGLVPAAAACAAVIVLEEYQIPYGAFRDSYHVGQALQEVARFLLCLVLSDIWTILFGQIVRKSQTYSCWIFSVFLLEMLISPIFWNPEVYLPAITIAACLFPPGLVLQLFG